jgi:GTP pyrophosphokinase
MTALNLDALAGGMGYAKLTDLLVDIARGDVGPKTLGEALHPLPAAPAPIQPGGRKPRHRSRSSVLIVGVDKLLTLTAKCCKPAPPEPIVGFVTRGRGISVHRADCPSLNRLDPERRVDAEWGEAAGATFPVDVIVEAVDRTGLLRDISDVLTRERINVSATATQSSAHLARMRFTLEIENLEHLNRILVLIRAIRGVIRASRR